MQLDTFITETLKSIFKGIKDAQPYAKEHGGRVNPIRMQGHNDLKADFNVYFGNEETARPLTIIEFDVAVTTTSQKESGIGGVINVLSASLSGNKKSTISDQSISRIKFLIGVSLPHELT